MANVYMEGYQNVMKPETSVCNFQYAAFLFWVFYPVLGKV